MKHAIKMNIVPILTLLLLVGCSSTPEQQKRDPYNDADSQRSRSGQAQDEMSRGTSNY